MTSGSTRSTIMSPRLLPVSSTRRNRDRGIDLSNRNLYLSQLGCLAPGPMHYLHSRLGLLRVSGSPPLTVYSCFFFLPGLFSEGQWTPSDGKPGTRGRTSCPGSASDHRGDAECGSSGSLAWHRPN